MPRRRHPLLTAAAIAGASALAVTAMAPEIQAERALSSAALDAMPVRAHDVARVETRLRAPSVIELAQASTQGARQRARHASLAQSEDAALAEARDHLRAGRAAEAATLLGALLERLEAPEEADEADARQSAARARMLLARAHLKADHPQRAVDALEAIQASATPIEDYHHWLRAVSYERAGQPLRAHVAYDRVSKMASSPMAHRARVRAAHMLFEAGKWASAVDALTRVNELYPDYPRRPASLYQYARALDELGRADEAAVAYQRAWFEYPYRDEGERALARLQELEAQGHAAPELSRQERYRRWRRLRINKHWDTARRLFLELAAEVEAEEGEHAAMVHEIWLQLALNAYVPKRYEEALGYLERLQDAWRAGHRDGISEYLTHKYLARTLAKFGQMERAVAELDRAYNSAIARKKARAEFLEDHGRYRQALELYDELYYPAKKRGWHYTWLLYKTGQFERAHEQFFALAERSGGRRRAKYLYWAARAKERDGETAQARALFEQVDEERPTSYYGIQARNRIADIEQRQALDTPVMVQADRVTRSTGDALQAFEEGAAPPGDDARGAGDDGATIGAALALGLEPTPQDRSRTELKLATFVDDKLPSVLSPTICAPGSPQATRALVCQIARDHVGAATTRDSSARATPMDSPEAAPAPAGPVAQQPSPTRATPRGDDDAQPLELRPVKLRSWSNQRHRVPWTHQARIFWEGRQTSSIAFARYDDEGEAIGPMPAQMTAYDEPSYVGGLERAIAEAGELFPQLERAWWLRQIGLNKQARWAARDVSMEFRDLARRPLPRVVPHQLPALRMTPLIDNRRREKSTWGYIEEEYRWPVPSIEPQKRAMLERQRAIISRKRELEPLLVDALKEIGDYYMVRQFTLDGRIRTRTDRMQANPRAFPELVVPEAKKWGINPYLIWSLMTVESAYNPDSVSVAEALGLLQVIPRTGLKTAELLGDDDFGHYDLLDEDVAIRHGVFYFSRLVRKFHGQELFAIAGYNGGPHRVAEWIDQRGDMPMDEFVEEIPFDQARGYTKKVLRFLHRYLRTYEDIDELYVGQRVDRTWREMPNF